MSSRWQQGESGNKKGRPPKLRILAQTLRETAAHDSYGELSNQQLLSQMIWEGLALGTITLVSGKTLELNTREWLELVKWIHAHIDGNYRPEEREEEKPIPVNFGPRSPEEQRAFEERMEESRLEFAALYKRQVEEARQAAEQNAPDRENAPDQETEVAEASELVEIPVVAQEDKEPTTIPVESEPVIVVFGKEDFAISERF
jgi:hypothetical protein